MLTPPARAAQCRAPMVAAAVAAAGFGLVALVDPHEPGRYPPCPWQALTGLWCPGCGGLRSAHDLVTGDVAAALGSNALIVALLPAVAVLWWRWLARRWSGQPVPAPSLSLSLQGTLVLLAIALIFAIVRNLPAGAALAP